MLRLSWVQVRIATGTSPEGERGLTPLTRIRRTRVTTPCQVKGGKHTFLGEQLQMKLCNGIQKDEQTSEPGRVDVERA